MKAIVVIPTYNERDNIVRLSAEILAQHPDLHILFVDDNSPDGTGKLAEELAAGNERVNVIHRSGKLGLGSAYRAGFKTALAMGADYLIEMDADFSHSPTVLPVFLEAIKDADLVIGRAHV